MSTTWIPREIQREVIATTDGHCLMCGEPNKLDLHHVVPEYADGPTTLANLVPLCSNKLGKDSCHSIIHQVYRLKERQVKVPRLTDAEYVAILEYLRKG
jgi:5-methylcytosine-specific restriction endonuclease McrA